MAATAVARRGNASETFVPATARAEVIARYQHLRAISREHHSKAIKFVSGDAMMQQAGRLGLRGRGRTLVLDSPDDMNFLFDLLLYTAPGGRSRAIDRYAKSVRLVPGSEEGRVLAAMQQACFALVRVERRHETAGLVVTDLVRGREVWLVDLGMETSAPNGSMFATRLYAVAEFSVTAGVIVPVDMAFLEDAVNGAPQLTRKPLAEVIDDRRFAETLYRAAFADGTMERVEFREPTPQDQDAA